MSKQKATTTTSSQKEAAGSQLAITVTALLNRPVEGEFRDSGHRSARTSQGTEVKMLTDLDLVDATNLLPLTLTTCLRFKDYGRFHVYRHDPTMIQAEVLAQRLTPLNAEPVDVLKRIGELLTCIGDWRSWDSLYDALGNKNLVIYLNTDGLPAHRIAQNVSKAFADAQSDVLALLIAFHTAHRFRMGLLASPFPELRPEERPVATLTPKQMVIVLLREVLMEAFASLPPPPAPGSTQRYYSPAAARVAFSNWVQNLETSLLVAPRVINLMQIGLAVLRNTLLRKSDLAEAPTLEASSLPALATMAQNASIVAAALQLTEDEAKALLANQTLQAQGVMQLAKVMTAGPVSVDSLAELSASVSLCPLESATGLRVGALMASDIQLPGGWNIVKPQPIGVKLAGVEIGRVLPVDYRFGPQVAAFNASAGIRVAPAILSAAESQLSNMVDIHRLEGRALFGRFEVSDEDLMFIAAQNARVYIPRKGPPSFVFEVEASSTESGRGPVARYSIAKGQLLPANVLYTRDPKVVMYLTCKRKAASLPLVLAHDVPANALADALVDIKARHFVGHLDATLSTRLDFQAGTAESEFTLADMVVAEEMANYRLLRATLAEGVVPAAWWMIGALESAIKSLGMIAKGHDNALSVASCRAMWATMAPMFLEGNVRAAIRSVGTKLAAKIADPADAEYAFATVMTGTMDLRLASQLIPFILRRLDYLSDNDHEFVTEMNERAEFFERHVLDRVDAYITSLMADWS